MPAFAAVNLEDVEPKLRQHLDALGPAPRPELLHVLILPDFDRADAIGSYWGNSKARAFAELLIDCEEDRTLRAVLVGMLREADPLCREGAGRDGSSVPASGSSPVGIRRAVGPALHREDQGTPGR